MIYTREQLDEIKSKIDYFEFYKEFLPDLQIRGRRAWTPCCFHNEQKPSMQIDIETGMYKCWGCGKYGDVFTFYKDFYNLTFTESVQKIADKYNVQLVFNEEELKKQEELKKLYNVNEKMCEAFVRELHSNNEAWNYLTVLRGFSPKIISQFKIGCSIKNLPDKSGLEKVGLILKNENGKHYNKFKNNRILFPRYDEYGHILSFTGRLYTDDDEAKYMHTFDTEIYKKSEHLFGLYQAKKYIKSYNSVLLVEGELDCIKCHQKGILNAVAISGLNISETQINLLKKYTQNFYICVEDEAILRKDNNNKNSLDKFYDKIKNFIPYAKVYIIDLRNKDGSKCDPDEYLTKNTREDFQNIIKQAKIYNEFVIDSCLKTMCPKNIEETTACINMLIPMLSKIQNFLDRRQYIELVSNKLGIPENLIYKKVKYHDEKQQKLNSSNYSWDSKPIYAQKILLSMCFCPNFDTVNVTGRILVDKDIKWEKFYENILKQYIGPYVLERVNEDKISFDKFFSDIMHNDSIDELEKNIISDIFMKSEQLEDFDNDDVCELINEQKETLNEYIYTELNI